MFSKASWFSNWRTPSTPWPTFFSTAPKWPTRRRASRYTERELHPLRDWSLLNRRYSTYLDSVFEKLYTFWNHQATLCNYYLPKSLRAHAVDFSRVIDQIPAESHHLEAYKWLHSFKEKEYKAFNEFRRHVVHYGPFGARHSLKLGARHAPEQERQQRLEYLNAPLELRNMILLARESYYHLLSLLVAMDALYFPTDVSRG